MICYKISTDDGFSARCDVEIGKHIECEYCQYNLNCKFNF